ANTCHAATKSTSPTTNATPAVSKSARPTIEATRSTVGRRRGGFPEVPAIAWTAPPRARARGSFDSTLEEEARSRPYAIPSWAGERGLTAPTMDGSAERGRETDESTAARRRRRHPRRRRDRRSPRRDPRRA